MKLTQNRKKILQLLESESKAFSASQIHEILPEMDLVTVYRNLNLFVESGLIRELRLHKGESVYEINHDDHEHAVCLDCGKLRHIHIDKDKLVKALDLEDFDVEDIEINIKGRCR